MTGRGRFLWFAGATALALATLLLFLVSRGRWSDPISDSGREWIVPDTLARGEVLYRDVVYWFGPLSPYAHALLFRLFGSSFGTLVLGGVLGALAALAALHLALRRVTARPEAWMWTAIAVPALVFMPSAGGALLGMGFRIWHAAALALFAVGLAARPTRGGWRRAAFVGGLCALAGLCRTEWGLAAFFAASTACAVRERFRPPVLQEILAMFTGFLLLFGGTLGVFVAIAGTEAVVSDGHVLLTGLPEETRRFLLNVSGLHDIPGGVLRLLYSAVAWLAVFLLVELAATWRASGHSLRRRLPAMAGAFLFLMIYSNYAGTAAMLFFSGAPLIGLAAVVWGVIRGGEARAAALVGFGLLALALSYRKLFSIGDFPYVAPPLLFAVVSLAGLAWEAVAAEPHHALRGRLRAGIQVALLLLTVFAFVARGRHYFRLERVPLPGTHRMLSDSPENVRRLLELVEGVRRQTAPADALVVFPEGELLNFLSRRRNPLRHKLYLPGYLSKENESEILAELEHFKPRGIVILDRGTGVYGRRSFGDDYGTRIASWIERNYVTRSFDQPEGYRKEASSWARFFVRKD